MNLKRKIAYCFYLCTIINSFDNGTHQMYNELCWDIEDIDYQQNIYIKKLKKYSNILFYYYGKGMSTLDECLFNALNNNDTFTKYC